MLIAARGGRKSLGFIRMIRFLTKLSALGVSGAIFLARKITSRSLDNPLGTGYGSPFYFGGRWQHSISFVDAEGADSKKRVWNHNRQS